MENVSKSEADLKAEKVELAAASVG